MNIFILVEPLPPIPVDENERDLFELPDTHLRAQLVNDDNEYVLLCLTYKNNQMILRVFQRR
jgi:hypothetical protein